MKLIFVTGFLLVFMFGMAPNARCQNRKDSSTKSAEADQLTRQIDELHRKRLYDEAVPLAERLLTLQEKIHGPKHADVATAVNNLAELYGLKRNYVRAEALHRRALAIREEVLGKDHPAVANSLNNLARLYQNKGDLPEAERLYERSRNILKKSVGEKHPDFAISTNNLGRVLHQKGDYDGAELLFKQALEILEQTPSSDPSDIADTLYDLALVYDDKKDYARPMELLKRALKLQENALGLEHPDVGLTLNALAGHYRFNGAIRLAEQTLQRALAIMEKAFGPDHPNVASTLNNLGLLYFSKDEYTRAEPLIKRALAVREKVVGANHPELAILLGNLATLHEAKGEYPLAVQFRQRAENVLENNLNLIISSGSEDQKQLYLDTLIKDTNVTVALHVRSAPQDQQAAQLALTAILRRKGRALDAMTDQLAGLRRRATPEDKNRLNQLALAQSELAKSRLADSQIRDQSLYEERLVGERRLAAEIENLQTEISRRSAEFRVPTQPITLEAVQQTLPENVALVELFSYVPGISKTKKEEWPDSPRYVAYVVKNKGPIGFVELGYADKVDRAATKFLNAISNPANANSKEAGRALDELVGRPIRKLIGDTRQVLISPDGQLNLVPFAALVDEQGKFFVEDYTISYLTSGRDILRLNVARQSKQAPVILANPTFDAALTNTTTVTPKDAKPNLLPVADQKSNESRGRRSGNFGNTRWPELRGTSEEAKSLKGILPNARVLTGKDATEGALKGLAAPRILHLSTHGFFLPNELLDRENPIFWKTLEELNFSFKALEKKARENELLRSGLVFAGANNLQGGGDEDGILTALEAASLNLWGTKLVVLSACETAVGDVRSGEGVYGLRRALVLAGTESQMMTLWKVDDTATSELIIDYYERLQAGAGRTEALRQVQLEFLKRKTRQHPFYWASFVLNGDWRSLRDKQEK